MPGMIHVGTSGWHYPHWGGKFYPHDLGSSHWLPFYTQHFRTVEVNNSFYRLPEGTTLDHWREQAPRDFLFTLKAPRTITHLKKLRNCKSAVGIFLGRLERLGRKLGPILFQLPPRWHCNTQRLQAFLDLLPDRYRYAFEFRDQSWHTEETYLILKERDIAFCIYDLEGFTSPLVATADFVYIRLHGPGQQAYAGSYTRSSIRTWAGRANRWDRREGRQVYVYFDNDEAAFAVKNARDFQTLIAEQDHTVNNSTPQQPPPSSN